MSGIYISGMKKPMRCFSCPMNFRNHDGDWFCNLGEGRILTQYEEFAQAPSDCPIVPAPAFEGALVERNKLVMHLAGQQLTIGPSDNMQDAELGEAKLAYQILESAIDAIKDAPAIIEDTSCSEKAYGKEKP